MITTSISTELGTHPCLLGNARALATVVAIIDGTGSIGEFQSFGSSCKLNYFKLVISPKDEIHILVPRMILGAAVGPLLAGPLSDLGWKYVFYMLMLSDILALLVSFEPKCFFETRTVWTIHFKTFQNIDLALESSSVT